ncbi:DNA N-6-adenine-methyltransferase [Vibrio alginolyticus]
MAHLVKSKTVEGAKNKGATRWDCFFDAQFLFRRDTGKQFVLDVAAEPQTAKVNRFYVAPDWINEQPRGFPSLKPRHKAAQLLNPVCVGFDGLQGEWEDGWWCNPPFDLKFEFLEKALEQARKGRDGMMLLPHEEFTTWWLDLVEGYATMIYKPDGRYPFYERRSDVISPHNQHRNPAQITPKSTSKITSPDYPHDFTDVDAGKC